MPDHARMESTTTKAAMAGDQVAKKKKGCDPLISPNVADAGPGART
ncbi:MAG: hypothetical protein U5K56_14530 [Halioglobus sp.]|nr:hypothetical protein [Halioglobus sp.]